MPAIRGQTMADLLVLIHPDDRTRLAATAASDVVQQLPTSRVEYRIQAGDGTYVWVEDRARREFDAAGRLLRTIVNTRNHGAQAR